MKKHQVAAAFNEWLRRYTEDPAAFEAEFQTVACFLAEAQAGREPTYGDECVAYLESLIAQAQADAEAA